MENILPLVLGDKTSQVIGVGFQLGIFDQLMSLTKIHPISSHRISIELNINNIRGVDRILIYSCMFGLAEEVELGVFVPGKRLGDFLRNRDLAL